MKVQWQGAGSGAFVLACALMLTACGSGSGTSGNKGGGGGSTGGNTSGFEIFGDNNSGGSGSSTGASTGASTGSSTGGSSTGGDDGIGTSGRVFRIKPDSTATAAMTAAMVNVLPGDTIQFDCGYFDLSQTLLITKTEDIRIKGCGKDKTVLSFRNNSNAVGILVDDARGIVIEDLSVLDTSGNGFELRTVDHGTLRRVRAIWSSGRGTSAEQTITADNYATRMQVKCTDPATQNPDVPENFLGDTSSPDYTVSAKSGRYGIYPVASENILVEDSESIGASDAGIYVGQTNNAIIRTSRSAFNVFGFEIENVRGGEYAHNIAECNTGGFLIYDLDGLRQYGDSSRMYGNISRMNNTYNFTSGGFVGNVPPGSGMITLSYDRIDIFDNLFEGNNTGGIIHASYELFPEGAGRPREKRIDWYSEGVHIFRNKFVNNGNQLPVPTTKDIENQDLARLLPVLVGTKNLMGCAIPTNAAACLLTGGSGYRGAHIVWDGLLDSYASTCPYPKNKDGAPVTADARGKPLHTNTDPDPACHYNAYKFDLSKADKPRIKPDWFASCIDSDNVFSNDSIKFANFHGLKGLEVVIAAASGDPTDPAFLLNLPSKLNLAEAPDYPSSFDLSPHQCVTAYGKNLPLLPPVVIPPFERSGDYAAPTDPELIERLCTATVASGKVNFDAAAVNCPTLDQYHLFADPQDPTSAPNGGGVPFSLNTKLFSDYAVKYRVAYMPPGTQAIYKDATDGANATIVFPTGTILAKTFSFAREDLGKETPVETRLLIKRSGTGGKVRWDGITYVWQTDGAGHRVAKLSLSGSTLAVSWDTTDVDSGTRSTGSSSAYSVPNANQCLSCHSIKDRESGSSPLGPKVRFMNGPYRSESRSVTAQSRHAVAGKNQLQYWCDNGLMSNCPEDLNVNAGNQIAKAVARVPIFNKPGDAGFEAGSEMDIESRMRAYLEVNCSHCHNVQGFAASTGLYLDSLRNVDQVYGICKRPTATGSEGSGGRHHDFYPGQPDSSIVPFRIGPSATTPAARMPPLARSVVHEEGRALVEQWVRSVLKADESKYPGSTACSSGS